MPDDAALFVLSNNLQKWNKKHNFALKPYFQVYE